ncbi:hypothetical protein CapIbe_009003 [Capra ibex]
MLLGGSSGDEAGATSAILGSFYFISGAVTVGNPPKKRVKRQKNRESHAGYQAFEDQMKREVDTCRSSQRDSEDEPWQCCA